ncbi:DUF2975 domain-containing protein [Flavobacterium hauense]
MNKTKNFAKALYIFSLVCFYGCLMAIVSIFCFSQLMSSHDVTTGYPLKVNIRSEAADTLISYKKGNKERIHSKNKLNLYRQKTYNVMNDASYQKALVVQRLALYDDKDQDISTQFMKTTYPFSHSKGEILVAPKDPVFAFMLAARYYLVFFLAAFIFWQMSRFFKALGRDFSFHVNLKVRLKTIAFSLMTYQLIMLILSLINMHYLPKAETLTSVPTISGAETATLRYSTYPEYDLQIIFFALGLLCIAQLLGYGYNLQKENDLTI